MKQERLWWSLGIGVFALVGACEGRHISSSVPLPGDGDVGGAVITVKQSALSAEDIEYVKVTVSGAGITPPIEVVLDVDSGEWSVDIPDIPAGENRTFLAEAFDEYDRVVYLAQATEVTIVQHETVAVFLVLNPATEPDPVVKSAHTINALIVYPMNVQVRDDVDLRVFATPGYPYHPQQPLPYYWSAQAGEFSDPEQSSTTWTAPDMPGVYRLTVIVGELSSVITTASVDLSVSPASGDASVHIDVNNAPTIHILRSVSPIDVGETIGLQLVATDPDGDDLFYEWQSDCVGAFSDTGAQSPTFTLEAITSGTCTFSVHITDSRGAFRWGRLTLDTGSETPPKEPTIDEPVCGDGFVQIKETCDPPETCPTECDDQDVCTENRLVGSADSCTAVCQFPEIDACVSGDGCCPFGCLSSEDSDCAPICGDENCPCTEENGCIASVEGSLRTTGYVRDLEDEPGAILDGDTYSYYGGYATALPPLSSACGVGLTSDIHLSSPTDIYEIRLVADALGASNVLFKGGAGIQFDVLLYDTSGIEYAVLSYHESGNSEWYEEALDEIISSDGDPWQDIARIQVDVWGSGGAAEPFYDCWSMANLYEVQISGIAD